MKLEPRSMKIYASHLSSIFDVPKSAYRVLGYILEKMNDDNEITIASGGKTKMLGELNMKMQTMNNSLCALVKANILANPHKGFYIANPEMFTYKKRWGDTLNQQRKFKSTIRYTKDSFTIKGDWDDEEFL